MSFLSTLLLSKIVVTMLFVVAPFCLFSKARLDRLTNLGAPSVALYRLYGTALFALVVAYSGGLWHCVGGRYPVEIVAMGLVSNTGATMVMLGTGYARHQIWLTLFFGLVALGFFVAAVAPAFAMRPLL